MVYFVAIVLSAVIGHIAGLQENTRVRYALCFAALLPLCVLAAFRSYTIGTDVMVYAYPVFQSAPSLSLGGIVAGYTNVEPGFACLSWVFSGLSGNNFQVMLFALELLIAAPILYVTCRCVPHEVASVLVVYSFLLFGFGLCVIRQSVAASFLLLAGLFAWERKPLKFILAVAVAVSFHTMGVIGVLIWPLVNLFSTRRPSINEKKIGHIIIVAVCLALCCVSLFVAAGNELIGLAGKIKYTFADQFNYGADTSPTLSFIVYALFAASAYLLIVRNNKEVSKNADLFNGLRLLLLVIVLSAVFAQLSLISTQLNRIGWLLLPSACLYWGLIMSQTRKGYFLAFSVLAIFHAAFFIWVYIMGGVGEIYPYSSTLAPFLTF